MNTFTFTTKDNTYTGTTSVIPTDFFEGYFGSQYETDIITDIIEEQGYTFTREDVTDWEVV